MALLTVTGSEPDRLVVAVEVGQGRAWREIEGEREVPAAALSGLLGVLMSVRADVLK